MLSDEGMSTRAIAPIVGADQKTIVNDRRAAREEFSSPDPAPEFVNTRTGEIHEGRVSNETPTAVTGMDGKGYSRPAPVQSLQRLAPRARGTRWSGPDVFLREPVAATSARGRRVEEISRKFLPESPPWAQGDAHSWRCQRQLHFAPPHARQDAAHLLWESNSFPAAVGKPESATARSVLGRRRNRVYPSEPCPSPRASGRHDGRHCILPASVRGLGCLSTSCGRRCTAVR